MVEAERKLQDQGISFNAWLRWGYGSESRTVTACQLEFEKTERNKPTSSRVFCCCLKHPNMVLVTVVAPGF